VYLFSRLRDQRFLILSLFVPLCIRAIPEFLAGPYPIGYDNIAAYVPAMLDVGAGKVDILNPAIGGWLLYAILGLTYMTSRVDPVLLVKIAGPVLYGVLGGSEFLFGRKALDWSSRKSFAFVILSSIYFVSLRVSLDLLRNTLGLSFLLLALSMNKTISSRRNSIAYSVFGLLVVSSHLLVATLFIALVLILAVRSQEFRIRRIICTIPAFVLYSLSILEIQLLGVSLFAENFPSTASVFLLSYPLYIFLPLIPVAVIGLKQSNPTLRYWLITCVLGVLLATTPLAVSSNLVAPERWALLMPTPLTGFAIEGMAGLRFPSIQIPKVTRIALCAWLFLLIVLGATYVALPAAQALPYYQFFSPTSMLQSTVPLGDSGDLVQLMNWLSTNIPPSAVLMADHAMYGWAREFFHGGNLILHFPPGLTLSSELQQTLAEGYKTICTVWWVPGSGWYGETSLPAGFTTIHIDHQMAVYIYYA